MKKIALIMGITGNFGAEAAAALQAEGWSLRALLRDPARLPERFTGIEVVTGDVRDPESLSRAVEGVELVVYGVNPPKYDWKDKALPWLDNTVRIIEEKQLTLVFPGNVYVLDPAQGPDFTETAPLTGLTSKGEIRLAMEQRLQLAAQRGARIINLRLGDFFNAGSQGSWLQAILKKSRHGYTLAKPGDADLEHSWAYLPDAARTLALIVNQRHELPAYALFHYRGYRVSLRQIATALSQASGKPVKLTPFPWFVLRLIAPFSIMFQGLWDMRYLWQRPINLDDHKLQAFLNQPLPQTPLSQALLTTLGHPQPPKPAPVLAIKNDGK